jgi:AbiV family abortive infection protein
VKPLKAAELDEGYRKSLENARELLADAELLLDHGRVPRAYCLGQLACEEVGKAQMLFAAAWDVEQGHAVDWTRLGERFRDHVSKGLARLVTEALVANDVVRVKTASKEAQVLNRLKNASLYVDLTTAGFQKPGEAITAEQAATLVAAASELVSMLEQADKARRGDWTSFVGSPAFVKWARVLKTLAGA